MRLVSKTNARIETFPVPLKYVRNLRSDYGQTTLHTRIEYRKIRLTCMRRPLIVPAQTIIQIQIACNLPAIVRVEIGMIHAYEPLLIAGRDGGRAGSNISSKEVGQSDDICIDSRIV